MKRLLQAVLLFGLTMPAFSANPEANFDQGIDVSGFIKTAHQQALENPSFPGTPAPGPAAQRICKVHFKTPPLTLQGGEKYAQAQYKVNDNCGLELVSIQRYADIPKSPAQKPASSPLIATANLDQNLNNPGVYPGPLGRGSYACGVTVWEEEVAGMKVAQIENRTDWITDSDNILHVDVNAESTTYFGWWYLISGPFARAWWVTEYTQAHTLGQAGFNCNGAPFCVGGPLYYMTFKAHTDIFSGGSCIGSAEYDGQVIPGGSVYYSVTKHAGR